MGRHLTMRQAKYFRTIDCKFAGGGRRASERVEQFRGVGNYPPGKDPLFCRQRDIHGSLEIAVLCHLGYDIPVKIPVYINAGVDVAIDYFFGDWWQHDKESKLLLDKSRRHRPRKMEWYMAHSEGMMLAMLAERWDDVTRLANWVEFNMVAIDVPYYQDELLSDVYKLLSASFRDDDTKGIERVRSKLRRSKSRLIHDLTDLWEAVEARDQTLFAEELILGLNRFVKGNKEDRDTPIDCIAQHHSCLALAGQRLGMALPDLPDLCAAVLVRRESLGL